MQCPSKPVHLLRWLSKGGIVILVSLILSGCMDANQEETTLPKNTISIDPFLLETESIKVVSNGFNESYEREDTEFEWVRRFLVLAKRIEQQGTPHQLYTGHKIAPNHRLFMSSNDERNASLICAIYHYENEEVLEVYIRNNGEVDKLGYAIPVALNEELGRLWVEFCNAADDPTTDEAKE